MRNLLSHRPGRQTYPVVICAVDVSGHAKVSYLHQEAVPHQTVPGGQVAVDKVLGGQVDHAGSDLTGYVQHLGQTQLPVGLQRLSVHQDHGVRPVGSEEGETCRVKTNKIVNIQMLMLDMVSLQDQPSNLSH